LSPGGTNYIIILITTILCVLERGSNDGKCNYTLCCDGSDEW
jgi:hypothetical protein